MPRLPVYFAFAGGLSSAGIGVYRYYYLPQIRRLEQNKNLESDIFFEQAFFQKIQTLRRSGRPRSEATRIMAMCTSYALREELLTTAAVRHLRPHQVNELLEELNNIDRSLLTAQLRRELTKEEFDRGIRLPPEVRGRSFLQSAGYLFCVLLSFLYRILPWWVARRAAGFALWIAGTDARCPKIEGGGDIVLCDHASVALTQAVVVNHARDRVCFVLPGQAKSGPQPMVIQVAGTEASPGDFVVLRSVCDGGIGITHILPWKAEHLLKNVTSDFIMF